MPALLLSISEAELKKLNYERYAYPCPLVQKRIFAVYLKAKLNWCLSDAAHFVLAPFICRLWCMVRVVIQAAAGRNRINVLGQFMPSPKK